MEFFNDKASSIPTGYRWRVVFPLILITWLSILTINQYAPAYLHADVIINSVMSLQNITPFYWGQNRLANALPLAVHTMSTPFENLTAVLFITCAISYTLIYTAACFAQKLIGVADREKTILTFLALSAIHLVILNDGEIFDVLIGHIEYPLPTLFVVLVCLIAWSERFWSWTGFVLSTFLSFTAIGVNFSSALILLAIVSAGVVFGNGPRKALLIVGAMAIIELGVWTHLSSLYPGNDYGGFGIANTWSVIGKVFDGWSAVSTSRQWVMWGCVILLAAGLYPLIDTSSGRAKRHAYGRVLLFIFLLSLFWLVFFSSNRYVWRAEDPHRYFTVLFYSVMLTAGMGIAKIVSALDISNLRFATWLMLVGLTSNLAARPVSFENYEIFQRVEAAVPQPQQFYAGSYWYVWPAVLRDLQKGLNSYGLAPRGESNATALKSAVGRVIDLNGYFEVACVHEVLAQCDEQVTRNLGRYRLVNTTQTRDGALTMRYAPPLLDYSGKALQELPSSVGIWDGRRRVSNRTPGCLVWGPYIPLQAGQYVIKVFGSSGQTAGAYADVTSNLGATVYGKFGLNADVRESIISEGVVNIPLDASDIEVHVCVSAQDYVALTGYTITHTPRAYMNPVK